jgi:uncharacterized membrane protein
MADTIKWRGGQVTRIEALTDAVFGFAITLLFVSFDIPQNFDAMLAQLSGFVAFAACFALITLVWYYHYKLFSRFDMDDGWTIFLNSVLLFVVLFYVYPLKFTFAAMFEFITGSGIGFTDVETQLPLMMVIYAAGYIAVFLVFAMMYLHAYRRRFELNLSQEDVFYAQDHVATCLMMCAIGVLSSIVAYAVPWQLAGMLAGFTYGLIGPAQYLLHSKWIRPRRERLLATRSQ